MVYLNQASENDQKLQSTVSLTEMAEVRVLASQRTLMLLCRMVGTQSARQPLNSDECI
jgi:hypothetical protein